MNTITKTIKRISIVGALLAAVIPVAVNAWGPSRTTFTIERPADYVTFNSITNNPNIGDERNFVGIRERNTNNLWSDRVKVEIGKEYVIRMYVHNNAGSNLNLTAEGVKAMINLPTTTGNQLEVNGFLTWNKHSSAPANSPSQIWDNASFYNDSDKFNMVYVAGSARYSNNAVGSNGVTLPDSVMTSSGATLGYSTMDGRIPGCMQYAGYLTIVVRPQFSADVSINKYVKKTTSNTWVKNVNSTVGETVDYQLHVKNTGGSSLKNVMVRDVLPAGMEYVEGSAILYNSVHPNGLKLAAGLNAKGVNIGDYAVNGDAYIEYQAKVGTKDLVCGRNTLINYGQVDASFGIRQDTASVIVDKDCLEPVYTCNSLTINKISRTNFEFTSAYTAKDGAQYKTTTYIVKDASGKEVARQATTGKYTFSTSNVGKYTIEAVVTVSVAGADKTVTNDNCKKSFEVFKEDVPMCEIPGKTHLPKGDPDCAEIKIEYCTVKGKEHLRKDDPQCYELPKTGSTGTIIGTVIALASLATSGAYYVISRKRA